MEFIAQIVNVLKILVMAEGAGLYLLYPTFSLFDDARVRFSAKDNIPETINLMGITVGRKYFMDINRSLEASSIIVYW